MEFTTHLERKVPKWKLYDTIEIEGFSWQVVAMRATSQEVWYRMVSIDGSIELPENELVEKTLQLELFTQIFVESLNQ